AVDRSLLEIATWEILFNDDVPDKVAIHEAVSLARQFPTGGSPGFVSGLLSRILDVKPTLIPTGGPGVRNPRPVGSAPGGQPYRTPPLPAVHNSGAGNY